MESKKIDYEKEVKSVYPRSFIIWKPIYRSYEIEGWCILSSPLSYGIELSRGKINGKYLWKRAYETLLQQGKIN